MASIKKKILVTGAAGFVGSHLVPHLISKNYDVIALVKNLDEKPLIKTSCEIVVGDLSKNGNWQRKIRGVDIIIHLAAQVSAKNKRKFEQNNSLATMKLIDAAKKNKIRNIIHFSSAAVTSIRLDDYARTKKVQEDLIKRSKMNYVLIRPSMMYGPGDTKNIGWLISIIKKSPIIPLPGGGRFGRQPVYIKDICLIVEKIINKGLGREVYEIHGHEYVTMEKMVKTIKKNLKAKKLILNVPLWPLFLGVKLTEIMLANPKFTTDQIKSLTSGERFKGDPWWKTFGIMPTKFETGVSSMTRK